MPNHPIYIEFHLYFMMGINNFMTQRDWKRYTGKPLFECMKIITLLFNFVCLSNTFLLNNYAKKKNLKKAAMYTLHFLKF